MNATIREQRRRKAVDESLTQNAEEKKRLLNVLAQRRYRARKRQRYLELERLQTSGDPAAKTPNEQFPLQENSVAMVCRDDTYANADVASANPDGDSRRSLSGFGLGNDFELPVVTSPDFRALWMPLGPQQSGNDRVCATPSNSNALLLQNDSSCVIAAALGMAMETSTAGIGEPEPTPLPSQTLTSVRPAATLSLDHHLHVTEISLFRASREIASLLHCDSIIWSATACSVFNILPPSALGWTSSLPPNFRPTPTQFSIPHSPVLDLLPWPAVRTKLITAFSLPESDRPIHSDGQRVNLMKFAHDIEDGGVRIWGPNPLDEKAWEVQPEFVQKWWWALDGQVLQMADRRRRERGEQRLRIDGFLT